MYMFGLHFALSAGQEHWNLHAVDSQLSVHTDTAGRRLLRYEENENESGFRPPLCTYRLNWARRTS